LVSFVHEEARGVSRSLITEGEFMKLTSMIVAISLSLVAGNALAGEKKAAPAANCEVGSKKKHVKDKAACDKEKGKWLEADAKAAAKPAEAVKPGEPASAEEKKP
jgi:hypothetical protein